MKRYPELVSDLFCSKGKMEIKVDNSEDLNKLIKALANEIVDANICHRLYCDIISSIKDNEEVFNESNTFWNFVFLSLDDARIIRLCRIFDQESKALNLFNFLETIQANINLFEEEHFRKRLKENTFVELLAKENRLPDKDQLEKDIRFACKKNPLVKKLIRWRNTIIAHLGAKVSLGKDKILSDNPLTKEEIENLLDESFVIFNRYSSLFNASTYSRKVVGHDDFKYLLEFIKLGLKKWDEDIENQNKEINKNEQNEGIN
ncbi:MAG: hypothetical protein JW927_14310 [Deltaproteobacteria bacterium]|nr:hypothetical protein [Deltaproteobacteria bacterium]